MQKPQQDTEIINVEQKCLQKMWATQGCESGHIINKVEGEGGREGETDVAGLSMAYKQHTECL